MIFSNAPVSHKCPLQWHLDQTFQFYSYIYSESFHMEVSYNISLIYIPLYFWKYGYHFIFLAVQSIFDLWSDTN